MKFEKLLSSDLDRLRTLQPEGWTDITIDFVYYLKSGFCNPIKLELDNKIVGIGVSIVFEKTAWLAHIIVDENYRNQGIGYRIVDELVKRLNSESIETFLLIATEKGRPIYSKYGFRDVSEYVFMKREHLWKEKPSSIRIVRFQEEYRSKIYQLDKRISGENRERLLYDFISSSYLYLVNGILEGYFLPDLKEGLIYAETIEAGLELMNLKYSTSDRAVLPSENILGIEFLKQNGFLEISTKGTRMILGKDIVWKPEMMYSRIAGNLG